MFIHLNLLPGEKCQQIFCCFWLGPGEQENAGKICGFFKSEAGSVSKSILDGVWLA